MDPLADEFASWSPFHYGYDNPLIYIDPTGAFNEYVGTIDDDGNVSYEQTGTEGGDDVDYIKYVDKQGNTIDEVSLEVQTINIAQGELYEGTIDRIPGLNLV